MNPQGPFHMNILIRSIAILVLLCAALPMLRAQTYNTYFGDFHAHTWYSDGNQDQNEATYTTPVARAMTYARTQTNGTMNWLGISDHNHNEGGLNMTIAHWHQGINEADSMNQDGTFAAMYGMEWGVISGGGHVLVYGQSGPSTS